MPARAAICLSSHILSASPGTEHDTARQDLLTPFFYLSANPRISPLSTRAVIRHHVCESGGWRSPWKVKLRDGYSACGGAYPRSWEKASGSKAQIDTASAPQNLLAPILAAEPEQREVRKGGQQDIAARMAADQVASAARGLTVVGKGRPRSV